MKPLFSSTTTSRPPRHPGPQFEGQKPRILPLTRAAPLPPYYLGIRELFPVFFWSKSPGHVVCLSPQVGKLRASQAGLPTPSETATHTEKERGRLPESSASSRCAVLMLCGLRLQLFNITSHQETTISSRYTAKVPFLRAIRPDYLARLHSCTMPPVTTCSNHYSPSAQLKPRLLPPRQRLYSLFHPSRFPFFLGQAKVELSKV